MSSRIKKANVNIPVIRWKGWKLTSYWRKIHLPASDGLQLCDSPLNDRDWEVVYLSQEEMNKLQHALCGRCMQIVMRDLSENMHT